MSRVLVVYGTTEGQARKIAEFVADGLTRRFDDVTLIDAANVPKDFHVEGYAAAFIAASVHMAKHNAAATHFAKKHAAALTSTPSALISVSLHAYGGEPEDLEEARQYADNFSAETGWLPKAVHYAAGALRFAHYDFFKRWIVRQVAKDQGVTPDPSGDVELTDWNALTVFVDTFLREHAPEC
ncbi:MAG: flavodoxin domain-containing protein [Maricaulaceae bacterium]|jgi:menaquinone-dependent protoporphyrinogen oxidase